MFEERLASLVLHWNVEIKRVRDAYVLTLESRADGARLVYVETLLSRAIARAWAGEGPDARWTVAAPSFVPFD